MEDNILTIITYSISSKEIAGNFTSFLEKECLARKVIDQSTYVSKLDREDICFRIGQRNFVFGKDDHVTLYFCKAPKSSVLSLPLSEQSVVKRQNNTNI